MDIGCAAGMKTVAGGLTILGSLLPAELSCCPSAQHFAMSRWRSLMFRRRHFRYPGSCRNRIGRIPNEFCSRSLANPANKAPRIPPEPPPLFGTGPVAIFEWLHGFFRRERSLSSPACLPVGCRSRWIRLEPLAGAGLSNITRACPVLPP